MTATAAPLQCVVCGRIYAAAASDSLLLTESGMVCAEPLGCERRALWRVSLARLAQRVA